MPKRKEPELTPAEQKKRFEALAREVGADASGKDFKRMLKNLGKAGPSKKSDQRPKPR